MQTYLFQCDQCNFLTLSLANVNQIVYGARMTKLKTYIDEYGVTQLAVSLSEFAGANISRENLNHWKRRGVPYKFHLVFIDFSGLQRTDLRRAATY